MVISESIRRGWFSFNMVWGGLKKPGKFGPLAETSWGGVGGVRTGSEGPIELFGDQICQNNESFS